MNVERFIAHRLLRGDGKGSVAVPIVKIAVAGIALGLCVMLLSLFVMTGFKKEITDKLSGFVSHLNVVPYASGNDYGEMSVAGADSLAEAFRRLEGVRHSYWTQAADFVDKIAWLLPVKTLVMDIYFTSSGKILIIDLNPWGEPTDPLLVRDWNRDWSAPAGILLMEPPTRIHGDVNVSF